jgi:hypothetical protein
MRRTIAKLLAGVGRWMGYGGCLRCRATWMVALKSAHTTEYTSSRGVFPLCDYYWQELGTPEARLPYYHQLVFEQWEPRPDNQSQWPTIEAAVLAGK